jgi:hypothetical protein
MRFADPQACPDCRGAIAGQSTCPHCGLDLSSAEVRQLWQTLLQADELLARATLARDRTVLTPPATAPDPFAAPSAQQPLPPRMPPPQQPPHQMPPQPQYAPPAAPAQPPNGAFPAYPQMGQQPPPKERRWSVGTILLTLGALGLIVAGFIFVTRSWGDLGLVGRTLVLMGVTAAFAALGVWVTRRPLRASAEAVWTIVLALLTLDFFAARHEGMLGLDGMSVAWAWVVWGVVALALSVGIALWARKPVGAALIAPAIAGGIGITIAGIGAGAVADDWDFGWRAILALVVAGILALATRPAGLRPMTIVARVVFAGFFIAAYVSAFVELVDHPSLSELGQDGHGYAMLVMAIASVVVAWLVPPARIAGVALAVVAVCALVITPAADAHNPEGAWLAFAGLAVVLAVAATRGSNNWVRGVRCGAVPVIIGIVALQIGLLADAIETLDTVLSGSQTAAWDTRLDASSVENYTVWVAPIVVAAFVAVVWFVTRWPELANFRAYATTAVAGAIALGSVDAVVTMRLPIWAIAAVLLVVAAVLVAVQARGLALFAGPAAVFVVAAASGLTVASHEVSAPTWLAGALLLAGLALGKEPQLLRQAYAGLAVALGLGGVAGLVDLLDVDDAVAPLVVLVAALAIIATSGMLLRGHALRIPVEAAAALAGFVALVAAGSTGELAVRWTIAGVALIASAAAVRDRRWYAWPGAVALVVAYVLLIVDSGFSFVEAYTLPLGAIALGAGLWFVRRQPDLSTWLLLGPGLALAMLPSVPQALADPTDLRALLLGLGAVVALALGIRLNWQAPFVFGATIITLLVLFNIGPYANAAPRVVLIAAVSAVLLGFGITWEDRVRDGRKLVGYVRSMR